MRNEKLNERRREARTHSPDAKVVKIRTENKGFVAYKTVLVGILILIQMWLMLTIYYGFLNYFRWYQAVAFALSLICAIHVLSSGKDGQTKTVWVLFLIVLSTFGYLVYFLSNEYIFFGWAKRRYKRIFARTEKYTPEYVANNGASKEVKRDADYLWNTGKFAPFTNSRIKYFPSGALLFDDVLEQVKAAEKYIFIEFFIIADGVLFNRFYDILTEKARNGVDVRIICDGLGSQRTLSRKSRNRLKKAGIKLYRFNRFIPRVTFALNLRDHRKIIVIDGKTAYTGGCNLADEYVNEKRMHGYWKDSGVKIEGAAVAGMSLTFLRQWEFLCKKEEDYSPYLSVEPTDGNSVVIPYADGKDYKDDIGKGVYTNMTAGAKERLYVMTPYFIPDEDTNNLLAQKALSGVDVRILLPDVPDKPYVYSVSLDNAEKLLEYGVKVYRMRHAFVHSKVMLSENCAAVGSVNIDLRSYYNQFENGVYTDDGEFLSDVLNDFENCFRLSTEVTEENATRNKLPPRILAGILRLFSPLM